MNKHYRHGDILLIKIDKLPENIKFKTRKDKVILEGEVTGHAHRLKGNAKILEVAEKIANGFFTDSKMTWDGNNLIGHIGGFVARPKSQVIGYAVVDAPAELTHEEHSTINIPAGIYEIRRQRECDEEQIRFVED